MSSMTVSPISPISPARPVHVITNTPVRRRAEARSPGGAASAATGPRTVRLTRRGRTVFLMAFLAVVAMVMVALGGLAAATHDAGTPEPVRIVEVGPGDTLYALAGSVSKPGQVREMVAHIEQLNSLPGPELQVGQRIAIPLSAHAAG